MVDTQQHHCYGCRLGEGVDRRHTAVARCLADAIHSHSGTKVFIEQEVHALTRVGNGQREHARMDLVVNLNGSVTHLDVSIAAPFSCNPSLQSTPLRATVHTFWMRVWSFFELRIGLLFGPWYVLNVMLPRCRTRHAERISSKCSHVFAKLLQWRAPGEKGRALAAARNAPPVPVTEQIVQEIKSLYPAVPEPPAPASAPISALFLSEVAEHVPTTLRKMPGLSEPGPLGMRAEHWYDFGSLAGNSDLFVQVIAHTAAAAVPSSVEQYLKAGQITPLAKPTGGHRPLLMMSFLRRLALKSVMAAKKESVVKCAGSLQYGVGRPDGANTMIKTIQYLAEADNSRVLVALDLKAAFQNVSRRAMLYSIAQSDADLGSRLLQVVHWHHRAQNALRICLHKNQCQQWGGSGLSLVSVWIFSCC